MGYSAEKVEEVVGQVRTLADQPFVREVGDHYAGYWDVLGLQVTVQDDAADGEVLRLRNELLRYLDRVLPKGNDDFAWQVGFKRQSKTIEVLFPGDEVRSETDVLRPI